MKRTLALSLMLVALAAGGLGYLAYTALAAESLRLEDALREAEAKGLSPMLYQVGALFEHMERDFLAQVARQQRMPSRDQLARAAHALPLVAEPYARKDGKVVLCQDDEDDTANNNIKQQVKFLSNKERIRYVQRRWNNNDQQSRGQSAQQERQQGAGQSDEQRQQMAMPQQSLQTANLNTWNIEYAAAGNWLAASSSFNEIVGNRASLFIPRFIDNELEILYWRRLGGPAQKAASGYGFAIDMKAFRKRLAELATTHRRSPETVLAILDDKGQLVGSNAPGVRLQGKPFVSLELHEKLPHWTLAAYWVEPGRLESLVQARRWTVGLMLGGCALALVLGLLLLAREVRRESELVRKQADFVSNVSHELKTPLTSIHMYAELIDRRFGELDKAREYSGIILAECGRLTRLVGRVLDFSRTERGKEEYQLNRGDLRDLLRATVDEHALRYEPQGYTIALDMPDEPVLAAFDPEAIGQLISNLLSNARKYGSPEDRRIDVRVWQAQGRARIGVRDYGAGVPRRWRRRIFDAFVRIDNSLAASTQGSGIGLALARSIARAHGGELSVTDPEDDGPGALFLFELPEVKRA